MSVSFPGIFTESVFSGGVTRPTDQKTAAAGFSAIFTSMLAKQMRESMVGQDSGPMGISGGAAGDIYGSFLDQALGKALAGSKSMSQLNMMIERELAGPRSGGGSQINAPGLSTAALASNAYPSRGALIAGSGSSHAVSPSYTGVSPTSDGNGPLLLPPAPTGSAPDLLPPTPEG
jgi:hypothetical protein